MVATRSRKSEPPSDDIPSSHSQTQEPPSTPPPHSHLAQNLISPTSASIEPIEMTATLSRTSDSVIPTPAGVVRVRPYRSSSNAQLKAVLSFTPRHSSLDRHNTKSQTDEFRGFFTLFWIGLALLFIRTSIQSWEENRTPLSWNFGRLITGDALVLALSDGAMMGAMFFCVPFVKALQHRYISYYWTGAIIQHAFQTIYLFVAIWWGYHRQWYWVQAGFLVLHALSNLMKMHSYMSHNGMLSTVYYRLKEERAQLASLVGSLPGGREGALEEAAGRQANLEAQEAKAEASMTPVGTPGLSSGPGTPGGGEHNPLSRAFNGHVNGTGSTNGYSTSSSPGGTPEPDLRRRSVTRLQKKKSLPATDALPKPDPNLPHGTSLEPSHSVSPHDIQQPSALAWSSNEKVAILARNIDAMEEELKSNGAKGLIWPQNVTYGHFLGYLFVPTLVYELEYPRTNVRRPLVVLEKIAATFGTFSLIYLITEHYIMPYTPKEDESLLKSFFNLALPMMINYLLIFYIIFECVCTGFAEISGFADREFYQDWWNSTSWDQFSRKWNKPVHTFLLRHVYASTMSGLQLSRTSATFITFLLSALCHELVMAVVTKKIRPYLFLMQMAQLPMIALGRLPAVKRNKTIGNIVFWIGLMCGFPLLAVCYLRY